VLISAKVGESNTKYQSHYGEHKNRENEAGIEAVIEKKAILIETQRLLNRIHRGYRRRKVNKRKPTTDEKVRPFLISTITNKISSIAYKWYNFLRLRGVDRTLKKNGILSFLSLENRKICNYNKCEFLYYTFCSACRIIFYLTCEYINGLLIDILLVRQNVERNPGERNNINFTIVTYNCNGLQNKVKLRRVLDKAEGIVRRNGIVMLQETHLNKKDLISKQWKENFVNNGYTTNSAGVLTLFPKDYKVICTYKGNNGRYLITLIQNDINKILVANSYFPNEHKVAEKVVIEMYDKILNIIEDHPDSYIIIGGDMNNCMKNDEDSLNRAENKFEIKVSETIANYNEVCNVTDGYRLKHKIGGYTWNRGECYSRLDYIFISEVLASNLTLASTDWAFEQSDHAAVKMEFTLENKVEKGPGIKRLNTNLLSDPLMKEGIGKEIQEQLNQIPDNWDPHTKLEFMKVVVRSTFAQQTSIQKNTLKQKVEETEYAINGIEEFKASLINRDKINNKEQMNSIEIAKIGLKNRLESLRKQVTDLIDFNNRAKWFEFGEKSNKYFLNLTKTQEKQKLISEIESDGSKYRGQQQVAQGIRSFYSKLYEERKDESKDRKNEDNTFFKHCPKLSDTQKSQMDAEVSLKELEAALISCKDSAPGQDGIPYSVYKQYWKMLGKFIKEAWDHSIQTGKMPPSHIETIITLLPKEGKNLKEIKNWRPIALSNCDAKIITKALATRMAKVLNDIIDSSQTAYIPGRSVMDNIRCNMYVKKYCRENKLDAILTSLDAKKAFDSVNHKYIDKVLEKYGFGDEFRKYFRVLYSNLKSRIMVNGHLTEDFNIGRGVKQGDALSCGIFILCIDPLLRNINNNQKIKQIVIPVNKDGKVLAHKASGYADDIAIISKNDRESVKEIFNEYQRLTKLSGLELNAEKTEILQLNTDEIKGYDINYEGKLNEIQCVDKIKICGIDFCRDTNDEYKLNVLDKINKFEYKLKPWLNRHLTLEGKILLIKTFGLSQLIYNMQCINFEETQIRDIEKKMFFFLWAKGQETKYAIDRIKRKVLKNDYENGGLKMTDVECLDKALKLRQYIRANNSNHCIKLIQEKCINESGLINATGGEFIKVSKSEDVTMVAQVTLKLIHKHINCLAHNINEGENKEIIEYKIKKIASIDINNYLISNKKTMAQCIYNSLKNEGIKTLIDLLRENEVEIDRNRKKRIHLVLSSFPKITQEIAMQFTYDTDLEGEELTHILDSKGTTLIPTNKITTKEIQSLLKIILNKTESVNFKEKLGVDVFEMENIMKFRESCKNVRLRNIYFRKYIMTYFRMKECKDLRW